MQCTHQAVICQCLDEVEHKGVVCGYAATPFMRISDRRPGFAATAVIVSAGSLIRLIRHDCPSRLRNESVSVVHTCRGGVLGT